jgi:AbrB family looped-hinge helix DNA binding protein
MPASYDAVVAENGRMVLPKAVREALGIRGEGRVTLTVEDDEVRLSAIDKEIEAAQDLFAKLASGPDLSTDDLVAEKRAEAAREEKRYDVPEPDKGDARDAGTT